jgi:hypothetical protein
MTGGIKGKKHLCILFQDCICIYFCLIENCFHAHFLQSLEVQEGSLVSCMRTTTMEDAQGSYSHEEEFIGLHINM